VEPEKVLVFEIAGSVERFANAVRKAGLEWLLEIRDEDLEADEEYYVLDRAGDVKEGGRLDHRLLLAMTNQAALDEMLSLWRLWLDDKRLPRGYAPWGHVFQQLKDVRYWSAADRVADTGLVEDWAEREAVGQDVVPFEVELWFRADRSRRESAETKVRHLIRELGGEVTDSALIEEIQYHAVAGNIPGPEVASFMLAAGRYAELVRCDDVMYFRPSGQCGALSPTDETEGVGAHTDNGVEGDPIVALLDGMPMQRHELLADRLIIDDPDGWAEEYPAKDRRHGTAMASLIAHGDLSGGEAALSSPIYVRPIMRPGTPDFNGRVREHIPDGLLPADLVRRAVTRMLEGEADEDPVAPSVRIVNLSIGDRLRPFSRSVSAWARCLDWLAYRHGVLFVVSAGNMTDMMEVDIPKWELVSCEPTLRQDAFLARMAGSFADRRLLSPAESINGLTVGAYHWDASGPQMLGDNFCEPLLPSALPATYSRVGHGFRRSVKPEVLLPGGRAVYSEDVAFAGPTARARLRESSRTPGQKVASPSSTGSSGTAHVVGTSNAAALATRAGATLHATVVSPILASTDRRPMNRRHQGVLLKALLAHGATWPDGSASVRDVLSRDYDGRTVRSGMTRMYGFGVPDPEWVAHCTDQRATLLGWSDIEEDEAHLYEVPLPPSLSGRREHVRMTVTVAWFTPVNPRHQDYRRAALNVDHPGVKPADAFGAVGSDVDQNSSARGTLLHRVLDGTRMSVFGDDDFMQLRVNCRAAAGTLEGAVPYALAVTLEVAEETQLPIYEEVRARVAVPVGVQP